jgi:hypothetical protein
VVVDLTSRFDPAWLGAGQMDVMGIMLTSIQPS